MFEASCLNPLKGLLGGDGHTERDGAVPQGHGVLGPCVPLKLTWLFPPPAGVIAPNEGMLQEGEGE